MNDLGGLLGEIGDACWTYDEEGHVYSLRFGDVYGSRFGFLGQSQEVFWQTVCPRLSDLGKGRDVVMGEWGFGVGVNFLTTWKAWDGLRESGACEGRLIYVGCEGYPLDHFSLRSVHRRLGLMGEGFGERSRILRSFWRSVPGYFSCDVSEGVRLILVMGEVGHFARHFGGVKYDAWYMDGFSPKSNPDLYREEIFAYMGRSSREGAVVASYSVASVVKNSLMSEGFAVEKKRGYGGKRHSLEGVRRGGGASVVRGLGEKVKRVVVVGEGIAGLCCGHAARLRGLEVVTVGMEERGSSGLPTVLVTPGIPDVQSHVGVLRLMAFDYATRFYRAYAPRAIFGEGSVHLLNGLREGQMKRRGGASVLWDYGMGKMSKDLASSFLGVGVDYDAVLWRDSLCLRTELLRESLGGGERIEACVTGVEKRGSLWVLREGDRDIVSSEAVILACGAGVEVLSGRCLRGGVRLQPAHLACVEAGDSDVPRSVLMGSVYVTPKWRDDRGIFRHTVGSVTLAGGEESEDEESLRERLNARARDQFPWLEGMLEGEGFGFTGVRVKTGDRLPLCGLLEGGGGYLYVLGGFGGHGFTLAPLLAEVLLSELQGEPSVLPQELRRSLEV